MDVIDFVMYKENTDKHHALLKCAEIISYYESKVQHKVTLSRHARNDYASRPGTVPG